MMKRRTFLAAALGAALPAKAAAPYRIYMVTWRGETDAERGFRDYLAQRKIAAEFIVRDAGQDAARLPAFAAEIKRLKPDLVYTWGTTATLGIAGPHGGADAARHVIDTPVVFTLVASPVGGGIVGDLRSSGRNVTGVYHVADLDAQLAAIRAYRPFTRLGIIFNPAERNSVANVEALRKKAAGRFQLVERPFRLDSASRPVAEDAAALVAPLRDARAEWLYIGPDTFLFTRLKEIAAAARDAGVPTFATTEAALEVNGVLAGLVSRYYEIGQFTAHKAAAILREHAAARDIPVETLKRFAFVVRLEVARQIGFLPPVALFNYAEIR